MKKMENFEKKMKKMIKSGKKLKIYQKKVVFKSLAQICIFRERPYI